MTNELKISNNGHDYFSLLYFARISGNTEPDSHNIEKCIDIFNSLSFSSQVYATQSRAIFPLIYRNCHHFGIQNKIAPYSFAYLKETTFRLIAADALQRQWLKKIILRLTDKKIPIILLKGAAFSEFIYPNDAPRLASDIDILVKDSDFKDVCSVLKGFMKEVVLDDTRMATHLNLFERVFVAEERKGPIVEIHRGLTNPYIFKIEEKKLWEASSMHPFYNSEAVRVLSPEDTLLHLAVHAFRDLNYCTHNILDAHEIWHQCRPDSSLLVEQAKRWGATKALFYLLSNCNTIMKTAIAEELLEALKPSFFSGFFNQQILKHAARIRGRSPKSYRLIQLASQLTFPDHFINGAKFQLSYLTTRLQDMRQARRSRQSAKR